MLNRLLFFFLTILASWHSSVEALDEQVLPRVFVGIVIKNNTGTLPYFLKSIENWDYPKQLLQLNIDVYTDDKDAVGLIHTWIHAQNSRYEGIACHIHQAVDYTYAYNATKNKKSAQIKNSYLAEAQEGNYEYCFIIESDNFVAPFTLRHLLAKNVEVIAPMLRPIPESDDPCRNFFADITQEGYYKDHPHYYPIAERQNMGTFTVPCVFGSYLIHANSYPRLSFTGVDGEWDFLSFSKNARNKNVLQFICNEREFGSYLHFLRDMSSAEIKLFALKKWDAEVNNQTLETLFSKYKKNDKNLENYLALFPFPTYAIYRVNNSELFYVDEIYDLIKSFFIKKGKKWEEEIERLIRAFAKPGTTLIDIGGHIGTHTITLSKIAGEAGQVHVFEPQVKLFTELVINLYLNDCRNVTCYRNALGKEEKLVNIAQVRANNEGTGCIVNEPTGLFEEKVKMTRLDALNLQNVSLIKMDVEGYEMDVLNGALQVIKRDKPVMIIEIYAGYLNERRQYLENLGYSCFHIGGDDYLFMPN